ncbi:hypothetical protein AU381_12810 [Sinorhizobium glycinis]|uniref:Solute-binding protein family 5 domain-containing protein n=1 Tax=Sinorhizobium glycinis TaxID=1472378 RepID=A0A178XS75_9HYPH|nr:ABC transporter substrate-binding protein [Sinorhizobium glycinis]OAP37663.1 hypothetical protein AU381_12810 [Sinorhizobium glycinis]
MSAGEAPESPIRAAMVETGEADLTPSIDIQDASNPETDIAYLNSETTAIRIDAAVPPLDDLRVRKALNLAIDWEGLAQLFGDDVKRASQMVVPGINGHDDALEAWPVPPSMTRRRRSPRPRNSSPQKPCLSSSCGRSHSVPPGAECGCKRVNRRSRL